MSLSMSKFRCRANSGSRSLPCVTGNVVSLRLSLQGRVCILQICLFSVGETFEWHFSIPQSRY